MVAVQGCTAVAVGVAVKRHKDKKNSKASAEIEASADDLYNAELAVLNARSDVSITGRNPDTHTIEAMIGDDRIKSTIRPLGAGRSVFETEAFSDDLLGPNENPAVDVEKSVLDRLDIDYRVEDY